MTLPNFEPPEDFDKDSDAEEQGTEGETSMFIIRLLLLTCSSNYELAKVDDFWIWNIERYYPRA